MSVRLICLVLATCLCLSTSNTHGTSSRSLNRLVGQQPLLFGRRGINPNMNSLFFGKRGMPGRGQPSFDDVRMACGVLLASYEHVMLDGAENDS